MTTLDQLKADFPKIDIKSSPAPGCGCDNGVRYKESGRPFPCLCVTIAAPADGAPDDRAERAERLWATLLGALRLMKEKAREADTQGKKMISVMIQTGQLSVFDKHLAAAGYEFTVAAGPLPESRVLMLKTDDVPALGAVVDGAMTEWIESQVVQ